MLPLGSEGTKRMVARGPCAVDASGTARGTTGNDPPKGGRLESVLMIATFDVAAPLVANKAKRAAPPAVAMAPAVDSETLSGARADGSAGISQ